MLLQEIDKWKREVEVIKNQKHKIEIAYHANEGTILKKEGKITELQDEVKKEQDDISAKLKLISKIREQLDKVDKTNMDLEKNREKITKENSDNKKKIDHFQEELRLRENRIQELQKKVTEFDKKVKMQQDLYDAVRRDKNLYFKNLIETQDDLVDKHNLINLNKLEIDQLKGELKKKDGEISTLKLETTVINEQFKNKKDEAEKNKKEANILKQNTSTLEKNIEKLKVVVEETAKDFKQLKDEYKKTVLDRDNLSSQLIRRNDEVSLLHEKIKILTTTLSRGETEFQKKVEEINFYARENRNLLRELDISKNYKSEANKFAREIIDYQKELLREKNMNKALVEEIESSEKLFHRWRKLEGIDPDALELQYKISLLQKRLIAKTEECVEKEITIQDLTKELVNSRKLANKRPALEIEESVRMYKQELQKNALNSKSIMAERNLFENKVRDLQNQIEKLNRQVRDIQNKYYEVKNRSSQKEEELKKIKDYVRNSETNRMMFN